MFVTGYANYPQELLKSALAAKNFAAMNRTLMDHNQTVVNTLAEKIRNEEGPMDIEIHKISSEMHKSLGDEARDLVYVPIAPCRVFDTRSATYSAAFAGAVAPGAPKSAYLYFAAPAPTSWVQFGGTVDNCPDTASNGPLANSFPYAAAINATAISPAGSGWFTAYRGDLADPSATVVSKIVQNGVTDTALVIVNACRGVSANTAACSNDIKIATRGTTAHVAGDLVGYFIRPQATALSCVQVASVATNVDANTYKSLPILTCTAGFTPVATTIESESDVLVADSYITLTQAQTFVRNVSNTAKSVGHL